MSTTSIGPEPDHGGNESHGNADGVGNKTLGENGTQDPPVGAGNVPDRLAPEEPRDAARNRTGSAGEPPARR